MSDTEISEKVKAALHDGLLILYRVVNHRVDYSFMNRPEPTLSGLTDHMLATSIVFAVRTYPIVDHPDLVAEKVSRDDGRTISYNEAIDIDWEAGRIRSTRRADLTKSVLAAIVGQLMRNAAAAVGAKSPPN